MRRYERAFEHSRVVDKSEKRCPCCKPCHDARGRESKQRLFGGTRQYHPKHRYGIRDDEFYRRGAQQDGVCSICGRADPEHVDHDHDSGRVRGIRRYNCNGGLGQLRDDGDALRRAADSVESDNVHADPELVDVVRARAGLLRVGAV